MDEEDVAALADLIAVVEAQQPGWRLNYAEEGCGIVMLNLRDGAGRTLSRSLPLSLERARLDAGGTADAIQRVLIRRVSRSKHLKA